MGDQVIHASFGVGEITHTLGSGEKVSIAVKFAGMGPNFGSASGADLACDELRLNARGTPVGTAPVISGMPDCCNADLPPGPFTDQGRCSAFRAGQQQRAAGLGIHQELQQATGGRSVELHC